MKRKQKQAFFASLLILAGMIVLFLPFVNQWKYQCQTNKMLQAYYTRVENMTTGETDALLQSIHAYNKQLFETGQKELTDPFAYEQAAFSLARFGFEEEIIGSVIIPKLNLRLPIYLGASPQNLEKGAAHLSQTSIPVGGSNTNAVISAHRNIATAHMLKKVEKMQVGDEIFIKNFHETLVYEVAQLQIIYPSEYEKILIQPGKDMVTLLTCHPKGESTYRYVVYCTRKV